MNKEALIDKYNVPVPRYTSYQTVPFWGDQTPDVKQWFKLVKRCFQESNQSKGISIYVEPLWTTCHNRDRSFLVAPDDLIFTQVL